ncbi:MAG: tol-pal system protein YbgF [Proteobacteria bacterium]|nr:tol-pal system protein YbgF [Pseudomonadota bacterium]HQR04833.1 tol-pal system protein YbgF [Rhodocyclaceae bacterium]
MTARSLPLALALALGVLALPARAGLFDDDVARARIDKLQAQADDIGKRLDTASKNQIDFANQIEQVNTDLAKLRGQIDELNYALEAAQKRQQDFYVDLDNRLRKLEPAAGDAQAQAQATGDGGQPPADPAAENRDYEAALKSLRASKFKESVTGFTAFIKAYPNSTLQASAYFWTGYGLAQLGEFTRAADYFGKVAANWPADSHAPDALLEQANNLTSAGQSRAAHKVLGALVAQYPASDAAKQARLRLKKK